MISISQPRKGTVFIHKHMLEPSWVPGPGQKWALDAPKAVMEITSMASGYIYYKYVVDNSPVGKFKMTLDEFQAKYCEPLDTASER